MYTSNNNCRKMTNIIPYKVELTDQSFDSCTPCIYNDDNDTVFSSTISENESDDFSDSDYSDSECSELYISPESSDLISKCNKYKKKYKSKIQNLDKTNKINKSKKIIEINKATKSEKINESNKKNKPLIIKYNKERFGNKKAIVITNKNNPHNTTSLSSNINNHQTSSNTHSTSPVNKTFITNNSQSFSDEDNSPKSCIMNNSHTSSTTNEQNVSSSINEHKLITSQSNDNYQIITNSTSNNTCHIDESGNIGESFPTQSCDIKTTSISDNCKNNNENKACYIKHKQICRDNNNQICYTKHKEIYCDEKKHNKKRSKLLKLLDTKVRFTSGNPISTSISKHGKYIYLVYNMDEYDKCDVSGNPIAEIFENNCGKLITKKLLTCNDDYYNICSGFASDKFDKFSILDSNNKSLRIRILDSNFNVVSMKIFDIQARFFYGGKFIDNDTYITITYQYDTQSILKVLRSDTLEESYEYIFEGKTLHVVESFDTNLVLLVNKYDEINNIHQSIIKILRIDKRLGKIRLIDQKMLPQIANYDIDIDCDNVFIMVGTKRADTNCQKTMFTFESPSFIRNDGNELRLYVFSCDKLDLIYSKNMDTCVYTKFRPQTNNILIQQNNLRMDYKHFSDSLIEYPGFFNICRLQINDDSSDASISHPLVSSMAPESFRAAFSQNSKWLVVTGSNDSFSEFGFKNVQLYYLAY